MGPESNEKVIRKIEHRGERVIGRADILDLSETGKPPQHQLSGVMAVPGRVCICTIDYLPDDAAWAEATFRSINHPTVEE